MNRSNRNRPTTPLARSALHVTITDLVAEYELRHNHGTSVKDSQSRMETSIAELGAEVRHLVQLMTQTRESIGSIRDDNRQDRAEVDHVREDITQLRSEVAAQRKSADIAHDQIRREIARH